MFDIERYINTLINLLKACFGERLLYVGLQGSYLRGEATENSDIDIMVILDELNTDDLNAYRNIIKALEYPDKSCGFICGSNDLAKWNPLEICTLINSTKDYYGKLTDYTPSYTKNDVENYVKLSLNTLYHEICHRYIHANREENAANLPFTYKSVFFILQSLYYLESGCNAPSKSALLKHVKGKSYEVLKRSIEISNGIAHDFDDSFNLLFTWCKETLYSI